MGKKKYTAQNLRDKLEVKYSDQGYIALHEVRNGTGWMRHEQYIDSLVLALWPSRGLTRSAFEIKVSRSDFLNELQNHDKNKFFKENCHEFWYLAPSDVIKEEELPEGTGWMKPHGNGLSIVRHAPRIENPPLIDDFFIMIIRNLHGSIPKLRQEAQVMGLEKNRQYQIARAYEIATRKFLEDNQTERIWISDPTDSDGVMEALSKVFAGKEVMKEKDRLMHVLDSFREKMYSLFEMFAVIAHHSIQETDEAGDALVASWGGIDNKALDQLLKDLKSRKGRYHSKENAKRMVTIRKIIEILMKQVEE